MCLIFLCVRLVICGAAAFRCASKSLALTFEHLPELAGYRAPSYETVKRWVIRTGYYKLHRPKEKANDWTVIVDASIQVGNQKALVIIGCHSSSLKFGRATTLQDFEPLFLKITSKLTAKVVEDALIKTAESVGGITNICSDRGSDILRGVKDFMVTSPKTRHVSDTAHFVATRLKKNWKRMSDG